jgi:hypothetical protein
MARTRCSGAVPLIATRRMRSDTSAVGFSGRTSFAIVPTVEVVAVSITNSRDYSPSMTLMTLVAGRL